MDGVQLKRADFLKNSDVRSFGKCLLKAQSLPCMASEARSARAIHIGVRSGGNAGKVSMRIS